MTICGLSMCLYFLTDLGSYHGIVYQVLLTLLGTMFLAISVNFEYLPLISSTSEETVTINEKVERHKVLLHAVVLIVGATQFYQHYSKMVCERWTFFLVYC